jgi:hypothetical protein
MILYSIVPVYAQTNSLISNKFSVFLDKESYVYGDVIRISGNVGQFHPGYPVTIQVMSPNRNMIYIEQITVNSDKTFQTSIITNERWKPLGVYSIKVTYEPERISETLNFNLRSQNVVETPKTTVIEASEIPVEQETESTFPFLFVGLSFVIPIICIVLYLQRKKKREETKSHEMKKDELLEREKVQKIEDEMKREEAFRKMIENEQKLKKDQQEQWKNEDMRKKELQLDKARTSENKQIDGKKKQKKRKPASEKIRKIVENYPNNRDSDFKEIDKSVDNITLHIFYDEQKREKTYSIPLVLEDHEYNKEKFEADLKVKQNRIGFKILADKGDKNKFAKMISSGNFDFYDHDSTGYYLQVTLAVDETFLMNLIIKQVRHCYPKMSIFRSKYTITGFLPRVTIDYEDASNVLKRIVKESYNSMENLGHVVVLDNM